MLLAILLVSSFSKGVISCSDCFPGNCDTNSNTCACEAGFAGSSCSNIISPLKFSTCTVEQLTHDGNTVTTHPCSSTNSVNNFAGVAKLRVSYTVEANKFSNLTLPSYVEDYNVGSVSAVIEVQHDPVTDRNCSNGDQKSYRGLISETESGKKCQKWSSKLPHVHTYSPSRYPDAGLGEHNFCRNPGGGERVWCFTTDPLTRWEYCNVAECHDISPKDYELYKVNLLPAAANDYCLSKGLSLALPTNQYENEEIMRVLSDNGVTTQSVTLRGTKQANGAWVDAYTGRKLSYSNWETIGGDAVKDRAVAITSTGKWVPVTVDTARWFICEDRPGAVTQTQPVCDNVTDGDNPVGDVSCITEVTLPTLSHNSALYVRVITKTGGYKEVKSGPGSQIIPFTGASFVREASYLVDKNAPVHCSLVGLCPNKKLWNKFNSIMTSGSFLMDVSGWVTFDRDDRITTYEMKIFSSLPSSGGDFLEKGRVVFSRTFTSETSFYHSIRPGYFLVELHVSDSHGNTQVSRKLILYSQGPRISVDVRNPITISGSFRNNWITNPTTKATISFGGHFFLSEFRYFPDRYSIHLPLKTSDDVDSDYDHQASGKYDISLDGLQNVDGIVKFEYQWTGPWDNYPYDGYWKILPNTNFTRDAFSQLILWLRSTDVFGGVKVIHHNVYVTTEPPSIKNLQLASGELDHDSEDLSLVCLLLEATDQKSGIMEIKTRVLLRDEVVAFSTFPTKYCQGESHSYCQCNQAGVCTSKPYRLCFTEMSLPAGEQGSRYTVAVDAVNFANLTTTNILKFTVDTTPPLGGAITKHKQNTDKGFTNSDEVRIYWSAIYETETNISRYIVMATENTDSEISTELILEHGVGTTESSQMFKGLRPLRPTRFCGVAYNTAGIPSAPVCSTPMIYDTTPPKLNHLVLANTYTQPGLAFDGVDFWFVEQNGTKTRVVDDCSSRGLAKMELRHYISNYGSYSANGICNYASFEGTLLLLSPSVFDIASNFTDKESGIRKVRVTVTLTKGGSFYDQVMDAHEYSGNPDRIIIYHNNDISWYTPRFYVNVNVYNKVGLQSTFSFGPCYFYDDEDTYKGTRTVALNSTGLWMDVQLDELESGFDYREPLKKLELKLQTTHGETVVDYIEADLMGTFAHLPLSSITKHMTPNQKLEMVCSVKITTAIHKTLQYESTNTVVFTSRTAGQPEGYVIDGDGEVDVDYQTSDVISASWGGFNASAYSCVAGITKSGDQVVWQYQAVVTTGNLSVAFNNLEFNQRYFVVLRCKDRATFEVVSVSSDGVVIVRSKPFLKRVTLNSQFGFDMNYFRQAWTHTKIFPNVPQKLEFSVQRNKHDYIPWRETDTFTTLASTSLLPEDSNLTLHLKLTEFNMTSETLSPNFIVDITPPFVSSRCLSTDLKLFSGTRVYHDGSCIKARVYGRDAGSGVGMKWVSLESKNRNHASYRYVYTSPDHVLICSDFEHGEELELLSHAQNGAGLQENRGCGHLTMNTKEPYPPSYSQQGESLVLSTFDGESTIEVMVGSTPFSDDKQKLVQTKSVNVGNVNGYVSARSIGGMGLKSSWTTRKIIRGYVVPLPCKDVELCGDTGRQCKDNGCPLKSRLSGDVSVHHLQNELYLHTNSVVDISWLPDKDVLFTEVTIIDSEYYREQKAWKVVGKDVSVTLIVRMRENVRHRAVVAHHYPKNLIKVLSSGEFIPITEAPEVISTNPVFITAVGNGLYSTRYVGSQARISWESSCKYAESYDVAVGSCSGCDNLLPWQRHVNTTEVKFDTAALPQGTHLFATIICYNKARLGSRIVSTTPVYVDTEPPISAPIIYRWTPESLLVTWDGFYDVDTDVSEYSIKLLYHNGYIFAKSSTMHKTYCHFGLSQLRDLFMIEVTAFDVLGNNVTVNTGGIMLPKNVSVASFGCSEWPSEVRLNTNHVIETKCFTVHTGSLNTSKSSIPATLVLQVTDVEYLKIILKDFNKNVREEHVYNRKLGNQTIALEVHDLDVMSVEMFGTQRTFKELSTEFIYNAAI